MPVRRARRVVVAVLTAATLCAGSAGAEPPLPDPRIPVPNVGDAALTVFAAVQKIDIARCRRTLTDANKLDPGTSQPSEYRVDVPVLDMTLVPPTSSNPTTFYDETASVSAKVPAYCPAGVKVVLWLRDTAPAQPLYSNRLNPARSDQAGRSASKPHTMRVPYLGPTSQRAVSEITVHAEAWNGRDSAGRYPQTAAYFCREWHYTVLGAGARPRQDGVSDCAATG